ncbi:MAG: type II toxin-antitoxin system RelE/ParE family toxin [Deltaproteobacteria bacterium]|jgi:mRNA-degrading endonuclease YafQ of YafQ-DinJ toxin-antitoxin module|uniref:Plasmid stabilization protein n=1 Tax=Candidatus Acidulodesulfobacterium acidiphilum TaxID=2597224 RepID=A0A520XC44_9DELT|nr:type II toxin-antitoxin system RelE/ParE family toxin [Deltaproteobacteria bacterium]RZV38721.1 MAG: plasmid stabilization protein [Candidatus Acidulodesulfobacterium acidiphilum]
MAYDIIFTQSYTKKEKRFLKKHPDIFNQYVKTLELLGLNPFHNSLRLHKLEGGLNGLYSVSINIQYRITVEFLIKDDSIIPVDVGTHDDVY